MIRRIKNKLASYKLKRAQKREERNKDIPSHFDKTIISWTAPEYVIHERGIIWKITMSLIVVVSAVLGVYYDAWTFSLAIVSFAFVYYLIHIEHPRNIEIKISNVGIQVGLRKYPFARIKGFWMIYEPPFVSTLNLRVEGGILADLTIQLNGESPAQIRSFLLSKIPEFTDKKESLSDIFLRILKI